MPRSSTSLPAFIAPQIPVLSAEPPTGGGWIHEVKHDGFRTLVRIDRGKGQAFTRNGYDWSDKYARVIEAVRNLRCRHWLTVKSSSRMTRVYLTSLPYERQLRESRIGCLRSFLIVLLWWRRRKRKLARKLVDRHADRGKRSATAGLVNALFGLLA